MTHYSFHHTNLCLQLTRLLAVEIGLVMSEPTYFPGCQLVSAADEVPRVNWALPILYRLNRNQRLTWQVAFRDGQLITAFGHLNGKIQVNGYEVKTNKSKRDLYEQAWIEGLRRYQDQIIKKSYRLTLSAESHRYEAMTGHPWNPARSMIVYPASVQPKLDGIRMICRDGGELIATTRNNKSLSRYVIEWFREEVSCWLSVLPPGMALDGEIYNHAIPRHLLASIVSTTRSLHPELHQLEYHVFDLICEGTTAERYQLLSESYNEYRRVRQRFYSLHESVPDSPGDADSSFSVDSPLSPNSEATSSSGTTMNSEVPLENEFPRSNRPVGLVPMYRARTEESMLELYNYYVQQGYEGIVVRQLAEANPHDQKFLERCVYRSGKSNNIIKVKKFDDREFQIVDITEGKGKFKGKAIFICATGTGSTFNVVAMGNAQQREEWFQQREKYIGSLLKVRYQGLVNGVPQIPIGVEIRNYEY